MPDTKLTDEEVRAIVDSAAPKPCPACGAKPGQPCYGNGPMPRPHDSRYRDRPDPVNIALAKEVLELRASQNAKADEERS
jgi:hypothetical protein